MAQNELLKLSRSERAVLSERFVPGWAILGAKWPDYESGQSGKGPGQLERKREDRLERKGRNS